jgi:gas vesicle protein
MTENNKYETDNMKCSGFSTGLGQKLMFFMIGGGIGAAIALLFAPKPGRELRQDIADAAVKGYDETLDAANRAKEQTVEYYKAAKEKGGEVLNVVAEEASALTDELTDDAAKIGGKIAGATNRVRDSVRSSQIF